MQEVARIVKVTSLTLIFVLLLLLLNNNTVLAAECSEKVKTRTAKAIAAREEAGTRLQIALAYEQAEATYQRELTLKLEEKYTATIAYLSSYTVSVKGIIRAVLDKQLEKARKTRTREAANALKDRKQNVEFAQKKFDSAFKKVPTNLNCTL